VTVDGGLVFGVLSLAVGDFVSCGLIAGGQAFCWGPDAPSRGGLGRGALGDAPTPVAVGGDLRFGSIAVGQFHTARSLIAVVLTVGAETGTARSAKGRLAELGPDETLPSASAVKGGLTFRHVAAGLSHTCALTPEGAAWCWAYGYAFGGGDSYVTTPVQVDGGLAFISLGAGEASTCGLTAQGDAYCWGDNSAGQRTARARTLKTPPTPKCQRGMSFQRAGDRTRTGDVQLGKLAFYH
jgi:alpha-tubulin suppressor-like RCC1 family protein